MGEEGRRGPFITFEGGDGVGKSTQIALLADHLRRAGHEVVTTREPGGAEGAEAIRALLVKGAVDRWSPLAEALLMYAARADHLQKLINPSRARGAIVLCDRFSDSTMAYQGAAGGLGTEKVAALEKLIVGDDGPDLTLLLDADVNEMLERAAKRRGDRRFESKGLAYQERVREAFLNIAAQAPGRCAVVDAARPKEAIAADIAKIVRSRLGLA